MKRYTFEVDKRANKIEIANRDRGDPFGVKVAKVNHLNMQGRRSGWGPPPQAAGPAGRRMSP